MSDAYVKNPVAFDGLDLELYFFTEVLKLKSLHYGYWDEGHDKPPTLLNLDAVGQAQSRFTEQLLSYIPAGVKTILDIGSGIGDNARALVDRGYTVTAISPDKNHHQYYNTNGEHGITFHNVKIEDFHADQRYDLIFISEALDMFDRDAGLMQCRRYLKPGGHLLVAYMYHFPDERVIADDFLLKDLPYVQEAAGYGFSLVKSVDITKNVLPTILVADQAMRDYVRPSLLMVEHYLKTSGPWKLWLIKLFFAKQIRELSKILARFEQRTSPEYFTERMRYVTLLFRAAE